MLVPTDTGTHFPLPGIVPGRGMRRHFSGRAHVVIATISSRSVPVQVSGWHWPACKTGRTSSRSHTTDQRWRVVHYGRWSDVPHVGGFELRSGDSGAGAGSREGEWRRRHVARDAGRHTSCEICHWTSVGWWWCDAGEVCQRSSEWWRHRWCWNATWCDVVVEVRIVTSATPTWNWKYFDEVLRLKYHPSCIILIILSKGRQFIVQDLLNSKKNWLFQGKLHSLRTLVVFAKHQILQKSFNFLYPINSYILLIKITKGKVTCVQITIVPCYTNIWYKIICKICNIFASKVDELGLNFETITVIEQMILTRRQINFQMLKNNERKIALNTTANKLYPFINCCRRYLIWKKH